LAKIDVLRHAAANAAPAISELLAVGLALELSEAEAYKAIGVPKSVALWCRKVQQGVAPAKEPAAACSKGTAAGGCDWKQQGQSG
jgi:hypothetical protein